MIDCRVLNRIKKPNNCPITSIGEMFDRLGKAKIFSKLDLRTGFHHIQIAPEDVKKRCLTKVLPF